MDFDREVPDTHTRTLTHTQVKPPFSLFYGSVSKLILDRGACQRGDVSGSRFSSLRGNVLISLSWRCVLVHPTSENWKAESFVAESLRMRSIPGQGVKVIGKNFKDVSCLPPDIMGCLSHCSNELICRLTDDRAAVRNSFHFLFFNLFFFTCFSVNIFYIFVIVADTPYLYFVKFLLLSIFLNFPLVIMYAVTITIEFILGSLF